MEKLTGKTNVAIFISGRGSNLKYLIKYSKKKKSLIKIKLVVSNSRNAKGVLIAKENKIPVYFNSFINKKEERKVLDKIKSLNIKLICLAGFMKIISAEFIKKYKYPIMNIHPSLLPKYKGLKTHERVLENKEKFSGSTVHLVTKSLDSGKIILQKKTKVSKQDNVSTLEKKILKIEHLLYAKAIEKFLTSL